MSLNGILMPRERGKCLAILLGFPIGNCSKGLGLLHRTPSFSVGCQRAAARAKEVVHPLNIYRFHSEEPPEPDIRDASGIPGFTRF